MALRNEHYNPLSWLVFSHCINKIG